MRAVIRFSKSENIKYISHLDVLRMFQRALKRAELPVSFSGGFHPHMLLSFALAAPVGVASQAEYAEVTLDDAILCGELKERLERVLPGECEVMEVFELDEKYPSLMAAVSAADYILRFETSQALKVEKYIKDLQDCPEIIIMKKTKKGVKPTDIKPMIYDMRFNGGKLECCLASGGQNNLRPDSLAELIRENTGLRAESIMRTQLYIDDNGRRVRPEEGSGRK